ncbi:MAG: hypothetical protein ABI680_15950, partial [Chthoniobacteraceae bacterium]
MTRLQASLILVVLWAVIYLPGLGLTEIKGEEGRRILPAITMIETGNWLVPYVGGKPYLRKPPLMNWCIAGAFQLTGVRNEWSARGPSALAVLALGLTIVGGATGGGWMTAKTGLVAALMAMTTFGLLAKARFAGAEIEGVYVPLTGMAIVLWMASWVRQRSPWVTWTVPAIFLGLAMLAKGPVHLIFFYAVVLGTLWQARAWRELIHPAHGLGILLMTGIFAAWAMPYFQTEQASAAMTVWKDQMANRVTENVFDWSSYLSNIPRGVGDLLPWVVFAPLVFRFYRKVPGVADARMAAAYRGGVVACVASFVGLLLVPGVLPRYVLPASIPWMVFTSVALAAEVAPSSAVRRWWEVNRTMAILLVPLAIIAPLAAGGAFAFLDKSTAAHFDLPASLVAVLGSTVCLALAALIVARRVVPTESGLPALASAALLGAFAILYACAAMPAINARDNIRPVARQIDGQLKAGEQLVLYDPGYLPV